MAVNIDLNTLRSVEELANYQKDVRGRIVELNTEYDGLPFPDEVRDEFAAWKDTDAEIEKRVTELSARKAMLERMAGDENKVERVNGDLFTKAPRPSTREADIYDLSTIRTSVGSPEAATREMHDRALRAVDIHRFSHVDAERTEVQQRITGLIEDDVEGRIALSILLTGSPIYKRAFQKAVAGAWVSNEESQALSRALSLTGASGGFAVPFDLDPSILGTSNGAVNPLRQIARVIPITGDEWRGVSSAGITAAFAAEATETTDNAPTLVQPTISTEKAQAFVPFSIEVGMDWGGLQSEMTRLLSDAKDELEATKMTVGSGTNEPFGVITGATTTVAATAGGVFDLEDLYRLTSALPPRYRARSAYMANLDILNKVRQFDTSGGAALWTQLSFDTPAQLLGKPVYENSAMSAVTTNGALFLIIGDFSRFVIVDRIGLSVETIQHLVGTNHRPTGQRGLYAFWRVGSKVVDANAFRVLIGQA